MCSFLKCGDPASAAVEWIDDGDFDFHQEIARASYADMLHDHERNEKYFYALERAIKKMKARGKPANVLDIGTGTGLLSMMAARLGADSIIACEAFVPMAKCAQEIIHENGFADRIHVIQKRSTQIIVGADGDMKQRANILVTEVFDSDFIGEGAIFTFKHALEELLEEDPIVVPSSGRVYVEVIESELALRWRKLNDIIIGDNKVLKVPSSLEECPGTYSVHDLQLSQFPTDQFKTLIDPQVVFSFDFLGKIKLEFSNKSEILCRAKNSGTAHGVFMWWDITMDTEGDIILSCAPHWAHPSPEARNGPDFIPWRDHWMQEIYYFPKNVPVVKDENFNLISCHDEYGFWFNLTSAENCSSESKTSIQHACTCNLHNLCSFSRIGMLNDPLRREKYLLALKRKINNESIVLCIGDCSLLSLIAAVLGAKKVYCQESCIFSKAIVSEFIKTNELSNKIEFIPVNTNQIGDNLSKVNYNFAHMSDVNIVITEPFFRSAFLPWHHICWKPSHCQPDCSMFPSVSTVWALPVNFDHLHKIRAPLRKVFDFSMTHFDQLISSSSVISDSPIELQPLWEYGTTSLSYPFMLFEFNLNCERPEKDIYVKKLINIETTGRFDALVLWVEHKLYDDVSISGGPISVNFVKPGEKVVWDMYTKQAIYFVDQFNPVTVNPSDELTVCSIFISRDKDVLLNVDLKCDNGKEFKDMAGPPSPKFSYFTNEDVKL